MKTTTLLILAIVAGLIVPSMARTPESAVPAARKLAVRAKTVGQDSSDQALAALYNRLFRLQDLRREAELGIETSELGIDDIAREYKRADRWMDSKELLKEVALDPEHRSYPNITESKKLAWIQKVCEYLRAQEIGRLNIKKIERDIVDVDAMIQRHLERPKAGRNS